MRKLSGIFRSVRNAKRILPKTSSSSSSTIPTTSQSEASPSSNRKPKSKSWCVYLILSSNIPIKTYVGVTTDFSRRLKQHNGELKGGAKASRAGRPWVPACIIRGFSNQNEACEFESKWKSLSRKLPRKSKGDDIMEQNNDASLLLLQHRKLALDRVKLLLDCGHLDIDWLLNPP